MNYPGIYQLPGASLKGACIALESGWKQDTAYLVEVAWLASNPVHRAILHVGFLSDDGSFSNSCEVWCNNYGDAVRASDAFYLRAVREFGPVGDGP